MEALSEEVPEAADLLHLLAFLAPESVARDWLSEGTEHLREVGNGSTGLEPKFASVLPLWAGGGDRGWAGGASAGASSDSGSTFRCGAASVGDNGYGGCGGGVSEGYL